jgi:hypothetical protein
MDRFTEVVARFGYRHEAELAKGYLDDAGIEAALIADDAGGAYAGMTFSHAASLVVRTEDAVNAVNVLREAGVLSDDAVP